MRQTARIISTYSADVFGVCSALFELGGMTVMHDASGCNSTYTTHDEPRWYDMDSMVYLSGLSEMEAIMGDDEKLIRDIADAASSLHPCFIAIAGTPIPTMIGFDFEAVSRLIEQETGIVTFGFPTTGMNTYVHGASMALAGVAKRLVDQEKETKTGTLREEKTGRQLRVNILGLTPLDFSINGQDRSIAAFLERAGFLVWSRWAMGCDLEELSKAGQADVNLVVSAAGMGAARVLRERFGIPWVAGLPIGKTQRSALARDLERAAEGGENRVCAGVEQPKGGPGSQMAGAETAKAAAEEGTGEGCAQIAVIGEGITSLALAQAIQNETGHPARVLCATECPDGILRAGDALRPDEDDLIPELEKARVVVADPLYQPIVPAQARLIPLPDEAFSGRIYRRKIPDLMQDSDLDKLLNAVIQE